MTDKERALMYAEVDAFLNYLGDQYINKIPEHILREIRIHKDKNYNKKIDSTITNYEDLGFSHHTLVFISYLNLEYWVKDENEKQELQETYEANTEKFQEEFDDAIDRLNQKYIN